MTEKTFLIRLSDAEREALRQQAATEHRSMQEVVRLAVLDRIELTERRAEVHATLDRVMARDADLLDRLAK